MQRKIVPRAHASIEHSVEFDGTHYVSGQIIRCSELGCTVTHRFVTNNFSHSLPDAVVKRKGAQLGWTLKGTKWICPTHARPVRVERPNVLPLASMQSAAVTVLTDYPIVPPPAPEPPKEPPVPITPSKPNVTTLKDFADLANASIEKMGRSDRRRIFALIMDNWDNDRGRYMGDFGDQKVANQLNTPRAWVEHIRVEAFGDTGDNEEISELRHDLEKALGTFNVAADDALKLATRVDELVGALRHLLQRLEKVEKATGVRR